MGDVEQVRVSGLEDAAYLDKTAAGGPARREADGEPLTVRGEVDRVYDSAAAVRVDDPALGRVLTVSKEGSGSTVVWSPGESRGEALTDLGWITRSDQDRAVDVSAVGRRELIALGVLE